MTKEKKVDYSKMRGLRVWLGIQTSIIVISSVAIFAEVDFYTNCIIHNNPDYEAIDAIGMFLPMGIIMGIISFTSSRALYRYISKLIKGISQVADGDFDTALDVNAGGPLKYVFMNFNKMTKELASVQTLRNDFINDFSHEFKTPITSINGFANLLLEGNVSEEEQKQYLQIIAKESERLSQLSNSTLMLSKLEAQQFVSDKKFYSLDEQIKQCAILMSTEWAKKEIIFSADLVPVLYYGNPELMQHIWINLIHNAIKFTPVNGEISVTLKKEGKYLNISITDTGSGMNREEQARIFTKYYQGNSSHSMKGLGLGLSITKRIIDLCGGYIKVQSAIHEGSTFTVLLPADVNGNINERQI